MELCDYPEEDILAAAEAIIAMRFATKPKLDSPTSVVRELTVLYGPQKRENFGVLFLDNRHRLIECETLFQGTVDECSVFPRVVVQRALELNSQAIILFHNHPSGHPEPSQPDELITRKIRAACDLVQIRMLDHIVIAGTEHVSMAERGII
jgi:DNA repair protein RadC